MASSTAQVQAHGIRATGGWRSLRTAAVSALLLVVAGEARAAPGDTELVSVSATTGQASGSSYDVSISADGRFVAFQSYAADVVPGDANGAADIFVRDREGGLTERVNVDANGMEANHTSWRPSISADGRFVVFESNSTTLVPANTQADWVVVLRDRQLGITELVSVDATGTQARTGSRPAVSADGRYVTFESGASDLVAGDDNGTHDVFVRDRVNGITERVSVDSAGTQANCYSNWPTISADGRYVVFLSCATNLAPGDTNRSDDVFVHDRHTRLTERVSVDSSGLEGHGWTLFPSISADGRYVAFASEAALVPDDTNGRWDIFLRDRQTRVTERISVDSAGAQTQGDCFQPTISTDGRFVAFFSNATNMTPEGFGAGIFVRDRHLGVTVRASVDSFGGPTNVVGDGAISADGRFVVFSTDTPLAVHDLNRSYDAHDIYVHELGETRTPTFHFTVKPSAISFGNQTLGTNSSVSFWIRNRGPSSLPIVELAMTGADRSLFRPATNCEFIMPGDYCRVRVELNATSLGEKSASLKLVAGIETTRTRPVTARVVPAAYSVAPTSLAFAKVARTSTVTRSVSIHNRGTAALPITSIDLAGFNPHQFSLKHNCPAQVPVGGKCSVNVTFAPTWRESMRARMVINAGGGAATRSVYLSGTGT
jgi:Tol biopolymer transport system component